MLTLDKAGRFLWRVPLDLQRVAVVTVGIVLLTIIMIEVVARYVTTTPVLWVEEIAAYLVFWYYILGAAYSTYERTYIKGGIVDVLTKNPKIRGYFHVGNTIVALGVCGLFTVWGWQYFMWNFNLHPTTMLLFIPMEWSTLSIFVGFLLMTLYFLAELIDSVRDVRKLG